MKWAIRWIVCLYPERWRHRYRSEFDALLEDISPGWRDLFDVLKGAFEMHAAIGTLGKSVAAFGVAGALFAGTLSFTLRDKYRSAVLVHVRNTEARAAAVDACRALSQDSLIGIMKRQHLYERERVSQPMDRVLEKMRQDIRIVSTNPSAFEVSFDYTDAAQAQQTIGDLLDRLMNESVRRERAYILRVNPPSMPQGPFWPNRTTIMGLGLAAGLLMGAAVACVRRPKTQEIV